MHKHPIMRPGVRFAFEDWYYALEQLNAEEFRRLFRMVLDYETKSMLPDLSTESVEVKILFRYMRTVLDCQRGGYDIDFDRETLAETGKLPF